LFFIGHCQEKVIQFLIPHENVFGITSEMQNYLNMWLKNRALIIFKTQTFKNVELGQCFSTFLILFSEPLENFLLLGGT
jgi:hypothetical protein